MRFTRYRFVSAALALSGFLLAGNPPPLAAQTLEQQWVARYNGPVGADQAYAVAVDGSGNVVVTGYSVGSGSNNDYYTAKYAAANGALLWESRYNGPGNANDTAQAVAVDGSGNVIVTGSSVGSGNSDYYTAKYDAANGALLWQKRYNGTGNGSDSARAVAVDASGNVIVTGSSTGIGSGYDYYTAKYDAATGAVLWETRYNGPGNSDDQAYAVAVDASGNVIVTGYSVGSGSNYDYYTAKYAAATGALLWEKRYNGPGNGSDFAYGVAVDGNGNVVVTGSSYGSANNYDYYTAKYAAANGTLLWEKRYNAPLSNDDQARNVVVDGGGNVIVTGYSVTTGSGSDYYTAKYAAADGTLLWEQRYNGPANNTELMGGYKHLALTPDNGVAVVGHSYNGANYDYATVKYSPTVGAPAATNLPVTNLTATGVTLHATVNPNGLPTDVKFLIDDAPYAPSAQTVPAGFTPVEVIATVPLAPHQTIKATVFAQNTQGSITAGSPVTVTALNYKPLAGDDYWQAATLIGGDHYSIPGEDLRGNDADADGDALTITSVTNGAYGTVVIDDGGTDTVDYQLLYYPAPGFAGYDSFTYTVSDGYGGSATATVTILPPSTPTTSVLAAKGDPVPGELAKGDALPGGGVSIGTFFKSFGVPSINNAGQIACAFAMSTDKGTVTGVAAGGPSPSIVARQGQPAPGVEGAVFASFRDPVLDESGAIAFIANLKTGAGGVTVSSDTGIWSTAGGALHLVAREGDQAPGAPEGAVWKRFASVALPGASGPVFVAMLATGPNGSAGPGGVSKANDLGVWWEVGGKLRLLLREGGAIPHPDFQGPLKSFTFLTAVSGSPAQGRYAPDGRIAIRATDTLGRQAALVADAQTIASTDTVAFHSNYLKTGDSMSAGRIVPAKTLGVPQLLANDGIALMVTLNMKTNKAAIVTGTEGGQLDLVARRGDAAPLDGGPTLMDFKDPVGNTDGALAFLASLTGNGVTASNRTALCWLPATPSRALQVVARTGDQGLPGVPAEATLASIKSIALPGGGAGPVFLGQLLVPKAPAPNPANITTVNNMGLWALDRTGKLQLIVRTGDSLNGKTIRTLTALGVVSGSPGQSRSFNDAGQFLFRVTLSDRSQAVMSVRMP